jgi:serine/threonine protein kinase
MGVFIGEATMFYCPKCRRTYEDGSQRFCSGDGGRLLPALPTTMNSAEGKRGVFSTLLGKAAKPPETDENLPPAPKFIKVEKTIQPNFPPSSTGKKLMDEPPASLEFEPVSEPKLTVETTPAVEPKPAARMIKRSEIASGTASVGDRSVNPTGRLAISWEKPNVLLGQTVKGRYQVTEKLGQDETSISYLAEDKLSPEKKVVVRVLMEEDADDLTSRIFAEERVSLSHLNHPNVAGLIDSGELLEGKFFIISEYAEGKSVKDKLRQTGQFNALRAARIVRQAAYALSEVHQNGVLHRNLKPENIVLTVNEAGTELVKVTDFAVSDGRQLADNPAYKSPEQLEGKMPTFASDIYSLAVIAYQMLTNRLPFTASSASDLINAPKKGLSLKPTNLRLDLPPSIDEILEKALAYKPSDRYPKARDFGDAVFNALTSTAAWTKPEAEETEAKKPEAKKNFEILSPIAVADSSFDDVEVELIDDDQPERAAFVADEPPPEEKIEPESAAKTPEDLPWEKRSPEPIKVASQSWMRLSVLGLLALVLGLWAVWYYFLNRPNHPNFIPPPETQEIANPATENQPGANTVSAPPDVELPPQARQILPPPNTEYFQNTRENLSGELAKYYRGFSFYYPKDWVKTASEKNFADVARKNENGIPIEQMLVSFYDSKGTFKADREKFPALVKDSNKKLAELLPDYRFVSEGEKSINGWKVYEIKFEAAAATKNGESIRIFGRRLYMPAMRQGIKSGFVVTMLATSLSPQVQSVDDVGEKGELKTVLDTFEPSQMY